MMSTIHMRDLDLHTYGELPLIGEKAPDVVLTKTDLSTVSLEDFSGKAILLNVYPSIDTNVCFNSVKTFNQAAIDHKDLLIACVSMDLPFALQRISVGEQFDNLLFLSDYRNREFGDLFGLTIADGPLAGLLARAVIVLDKDHKVIYHELVDEITEQPNYEKALKALMGNND